MSDERVEGALPGPEPSAAAPTRGRLRVALIAAAVLCVIGAAALLSGSPDAPGPGGDAAATLDAALAAGQPAYILIHSLT